MNENKYFDCHKEIIKEICIYLNNCANCYDEELHCTKCDSLNCTKFQISKTTKDYFYMEIYSDDIFYFSFHYFSNLIILSPFSVVNCALYPFLSAILIKS